MNSGAGFLLIIGGLLLLYTVITGKFSILEETFYKLFEITAPASVDKPATPKSQSQSDKEAGGHLDSPNIGTGVITLPQIFIPQYT